MIKAEIEICKFDTPILCDEGEFEQWNTQHNSYALPF